MSDLGKYWASTPDVAANPLNKNTESGVFHRIDIAGVASSILATPTTAKARPLNELAGFFFAEHNQFIARSAVNLR